jgi:hypothetical protein
VVLLHDVLYHTIEPRYANRAPVLQAVDLLLEQLGNRFRFISVPEMFRYGYPEKRNWYREADPVWLNSLHGQWGETRRYHQAGASR